MSLQAQQRIALFIPTLEGGGSEQNTLRLAAGFLQAGYAVDLIVKAGRGELLLQVPPGVQLIDLQASRLSAAIPGLARYLRRNQPQALISGLDLPNLASILASRLARTHTRVFVTVRSLLSQSHAGSSLSTAPMRFLMRRLYRLADQIIATSKAAGKDFCSSLGLPPSFVKTIYNPMITTDLAQKSRQPVTHPWLTPGSSPVILSAGRLVPVKDHATLLRATALVRQSSPARLLILGEGDQRPALEELGQTLGLGADMQLPGFQINPYAIMSKARVFVLSSRYDASPNVLVEALACGCPVISTNCPGGAAEFLNGGKFGRLVPVADPPALANAILSAFSEEVPMPDAQWLSQFEQGSVIQQYLKLISETGQP